MDITFSDRKLRKVADDERKIKAQYGKIRGGKIKLRLDQLKAAESLEDLRHASGNYHELTSDRKGQWSCSLDANYRLIFTPHEDPIPTDDDGNYLWIEIHAVDIIEIVDYH